MSDDRRVKMIKEAFYSRYKNALRLLSDDMQRVLVAGLVMEVMLMQEDTDQRISRYTALYVASLKELHLGD